MELSLLYQNNLLMFLPEVFLAISVLILTIHGSFLTTSRILNFPILTTSFSHLSILVLALLSILIFNNAIPLMFTYHSSFIFDSLSCNVKKILAITSLFCLFISTDSILKNFITSFEYFILILCAILGLNFLVSSYDLLSLYLAIELQSLCLYVLASKKKSSFSTEAGLKYFFLGSLSSAVLLFGVSILYGSLGTTNFENFSLLFTFPYGQSLQGLTPIIEKAIFCVALAFFFKIGAAPFHMWAPDVYEGSPISSTIFFAIIPKIALFAIFLRLFQSIFFTFTDTFVFCLCTFSLFSVIVGALGALQQKKLKRLLAYSSISHVGYLLLAFASNSLEATEALFFYLIIYTITSFCIWSIVLSLNSSQNKDKNKTITDLTVIASQNPLLGFTSLLAFFSLAGIPPLVGFYAKMQIFIFTLGSSLFFFSFVAILFSVISCFFYIRLIKNIYFEKNQENIYIYPVSQVCSLILAVSAFLLIFFFLDPILLLLLSQKMSLCIFF
jgi:NADH-quinone oxidoreductase subunit N